ncbi:MAG: substrate-binding domain-containing protein, partial [Protaetiibacter sp.]
PLVTLQAPDRPGGIGVDQAAGARLATRHLIDLGHRRIQHLAGPEGYLEAGARRDGYLATMRDAGLAAGAELAGDWSAASGFAAAASLDPATTAVVAANDQMAIGLIAALADAGRAVPGEVSVVGFDDIPEAAFVRPALTTVHQDFELVGRRAVESLIEQLSGRAQPADGAPVPRSARLVEPRLELRGSTATPA